MRMNNWLDGHKMLSVYHFVNKFSLKNTVRCVWGYGGNCIVVSVFDCNVHAKDDDDAATDGPAAKRASLQYIREYYY